MELEQRLKAIESRLARIEALSGSQDLARQLAAAGGISLADQQAAAYQKSRSRQDK